MWLRMGVSGGHARQKVICKGPEAGLGQLGQRLEKHRGGSGL